MKPRAGTGRVTRWSAEQRLIMLSAGTAQRRATMSAQAEELGGLVNWALLAEMLSTRRLLPTLGPRILELVGDRAECDFAIAVKQATDTGRRLGAFLQMLAERVRAELVDAGIRCTILKGPLLSEALYGDPGRRPSGDIDLLVAREQMYEAVEVVRGLGYEAPTDYVGNHGLPLLHFAMGHQDLQWPPVELHWRIHWYEQRFASERLLAPAGAAAGPRWRPAPINELTALLLFYARDGFIDLRPAADLGAWWDAYGARLRPGELDELICTYPALEHVLRVAITVAEKMAGLPKDRLIETRPRPSPRDHIAIRLANPHPHLSREQLYADIGLIDGLLTPPRDFRAFVTRQLIPPREVLLEHARRDQRRRPNSRWGHGIRMLGRYGLTLTRLAHAPAAVAAETRHS